MTAEPQSDEYLLGRICERDADAFEMLLARYQESVRGHLLRMVRDPNTAEDLAQEVFVRVWMRGEQWNGHGPFRVWLLRIATNTALNYLRTVRRRRECPLELPAASWSIWSKSCRAGSAKCSAWSSMPRWRSKTSRRRLASRLEPSAPASTTSANASPANGTRIESKEPHNGHVCALAQGLVRCFYS